MGRLRHAVGLRNLGAGQQVAGKTKSAKTAALPSFKQYRESDGQFYFKLLDARGELLLQSLAFATPQEAGKAIGLLQSQRGAALSALVGRLQPLPAESAEAVTEALDVLAAANEDKKK